MSLHGAETPARATRPPILGVARVAFYVADPSAAQAFYCDYLGYAPPERLAGPAGGAIARIRINERQSLDLIADPATPSDADRLHHIAFTVGSAEAMRSYLDAQGIAVPAQTTLGLDGDRSFFVKDPEGHLLEFVEPQAGGWILRAAGHALPDTRVAPRLNHAGVLVGRFDATMHFYRDVLGFRETWRGTAGAWLSWVNLQVPEGSELIELMLYSEQEPPNREVRLRKHHLCLEIDDLAAAMALLASRKPPAGCPPPGNGSIGLNGRRQVNYFAPDGTRVEIMEARFATGKPTPSSDAPLPK